MQKTTTLSVTESETVSDVTCAQDMMCAKNFIDSIGLEVELLMILEIDNMGTVDMAQNFRQGVGQNIWRLGCFC